MPALDFSSTSCERAGGGVLARQPARAAPISFRHIASEYGSWPVEPAAHQIRKLLRPARACRISGMIEPRKGSNGTLSRKKKVSLVVMASTTWEMRLDRN